VSGSHVLDLRLLTDVYSEKFLKKLLGNTEIEDALHDLDKLTQEEALMASAELLKMTHGVDGKVMGVDNRVKDVDERVQEVGGDVQGVSNKVQAVDDMLDQVSRTSSHKVPPHS
jgi:hypothetical protein